MARILIVDNEANILSVLSTLLKAEGYDAIPVREAAKAQEMISTEEFDLLISDIRMTPINGMELLKTTRKAAPSMSVIMLTAYGSVETAIEAMKLGAFDYVTKPFKVDELLITVQRALEYRRALTENLNLKNQLETRYRFENIVAESQAMHDVCAMIERVAPTDTTVLIYGESGTGKELVAKAIHAHSKRKEKKFLGVNCAALPEPLLESEMFGHVKGAFTGASANKKGLFEAADGGTILLDEIGSMSLSIQGKLLRILQSKEIRKVGSNENIPIDARILAATNRRLEEMIEQGTFREDLYYRLSVIPIEIKPLRDRPDDLLPLVYHVIQQEMGDAAEGVQLTTEARKIIERYTWPGNVRELENALKHAITFARDRTITLDVLPPRIIKAVELGDIGFEDGSDLHKCKSLKTFLRTREEDYIKQVLESFGGNKEKAARALKISLATLYRKLPSAAPDIEPPDSTKE